MANTQLPKTYKSWILNEYCKGPINENTFKLVEKDLPDINSLPANHVLVRVQRLAMEPSMRPSISLGKSYREPQPLNEPMWAYGMGTVVGSNAQNFNVGQLVVGRFEMQEYALIDTSVPRNCNPADSRIGLEYLSALGASGRAAWWGMNEVGKVKKGDVVVVSAAGGATGIVAVQIAKAAGASQVIGIASGGKRQTVLNAGADECLDYKSDTFAKDLRKITSEKVSLYFDNTGGAVTDAVLSAMAPHGRIAVCGAIAGYQQIGDKTAEPYRMRSWTFILTMRLNIQGFVITECTMDDFKKTTEGLLGLLREGKVKTEIYTFPQKGVEHCIDALQGLFTGMNTGKMTIQIAD